MAKKKLCDMAPYERVASRMKGLTWDEAEDVGVEILARVLAFHTYVRNEDEAYFEGLMRRICERADGWAKDEGTFALAMASAAAGYEDELNGVAS